MCIEVGDKIRVTGSFGVSHYGIYVGARRGFRYGVVHNDKAGGVQLVDFALSQMVVRSMSRQGFPGAGWPASAWLARALVLVGRKYDLLNFNSLVDDVRQ